MIFGGEGHSTYLGCLSCSEYATDSLLNTYGDHGSRYSNESVWNHYSDFGSRYSNYGAATPMRMIRQSSLTRKAGSTVA